MPDENTPRPDLPADSLSGCGTVFLAGWTRERLLAEFQRHDIAMNAMGWQLFAALQLPGVRRAYEVWELTAADLGFPEGAITQDVWQRAEERGFRLWPLEAAPYLRLASLEQAGDDWRIVASHGLSKRPATRSPDEPPAPSGFYLRRLEGQFWLRGYTASEDYIWNAETRFLFTR